MTDVKPKVLLVDDDQDLINLVKGYLEDINADIIMVSSAEQALDVMNVQSPSCIICDFHLPKTNGLELIKKINSKFGVKNVFFFCGMISAKCAQEIKKLEGAQLIYKPDVSLLKKSVQESLLTT